MVSTCISQTIQCLHYKTLTKMNVGVTQSVLFSSCFNQTLQFSTYFRRSPSTNFLWNPSSARQDVPCGWQDRHDKANSHCPQLFPHTCLETYPDTDRTVSIFQFWRHIGHFPWYCVAAANPYRKRQECQFTTVQPVSIIAELNHHYCSPTK